MNLSPNLSLKIIKQLLFCCLGILIISGVTSCEKEEPNTLSVSMDEITIPSEGGNVAISLETNANSWSIDNPAQSWITVSETSGTNHRASLLLKVTTQTLTPRKDTLVVSAGDAKSVYIIVSQISSDYLYKLRVSTEEVKLDEGVGSATIEITSDAPEWALSSSADWIQLSQTTGASGTFNVSLTVSANDETADRTATLVLSGYGAPSSEITITQSVGYPNYNTSPLDPDMTGMSSSATDIASRINIGWNIGNTLEAIGGETAWGNPKITESYVKYIKQLGFSAVRLPCSWNQNANQNSAEIKLTWLNRVKEVVEYCVSNDLYVILNIHWDGGWLENNCTESMQVENNAKQKAFWQQIATHLRDFDEHLIFAGANEPNVANSTQMKVLQSYHQTFIDAVRSTGGKNSYRVLVVQGPNTDIENTYKLMTKMPVDQVANRLMAEIHYYTPWNYTGMQKDESWGNMFYYWGKDFHSTTDVAHNPTWGEEATVDEFLALMKTKFVDKGIPVIMGEYGCGVRTDLVGDALELHKASRSYYFKYVTQQAKANGILPFFWDTGGMLDRRNNTVKDQLGFDGLMGGITN